MSHPLSVIEVRLLRTSAARCLRTALVFLALQVPMWLAITRSATADATTTIAARCSLLLDVGFALALVAFSIRACEYLRANGVRPAVLRRSRMAAGALAVAGLLDLVENGLLWQRFSPDGGPRPSLVVPGLSPGWWTLAAMAGVALAVLGAATDRRLVPGLGDPRTSASIAEDPATGGGTVIACSGGGIRSASFCLGALQALMRHGVYRRAAAVVGVSGGGYMAAAFHLIGRDLEPDDDPPFAQGTAELALLRRNTRYLLPRGVVVFRGVLSVLFGVVVNIAMILAALRGLSWVLGWYLDEYDVVSVEAENLTVSPSPVWVAVALVPWAAAVGVFVVVEKVADRFVHVADRWRLGLRWFFRTALLTGAATVVLMLAVPYSLLALSSQAGSGQTLPAALAKLVDPGPVSLATAAGVVTSLIALGRTVITGLGKVDEDGTRGSRLLTRLRVVVAPWLGTVLIVLAAWLVLLRWTNGYATRQAWQSDWDKALWFAAVVVAIRLLTDANRTSLHHFYRERLASAYLVRRVDARHAEARKYHQPVRVSEYAGHDPRHPEGPELVMAAVANVVDEDFVPTGRGCVPFIIAADRTGVVGDRTLPPGGTTRTRRYEAFADYGGRDLTVPAAMAISGAAFSPLAGRASARTRPVRVLLTVLNARLGVWLPNPYGQPPAFIGRAQREREEYDATPTDRRTSGARTRLAGWELLAHAVSVAGKPGPYRLLREAFGRPTLYDRKLYITDGGHYDNLGLVEALRRRPERVVVIDASNDAENSFGALADAIATARMDLGVEVSIDTAPLRSSEQGRAPSAWTVGSARHADGLVTDVIYLKALLAGSLPADVEHYARQNPDFPRRSTGQQLYDEWDFEAYRELGHSLADGMITGSGLVRRRPRFSSVPGARAG